MSLTFNGTGVQRSLVRKIPEPLDATSTFNTYADATEYAIDETGTYSYCPYAGQLVVTLAGGVRTVDGVEQVIPQSDPEYNKARLWRLKQDGTNNKSRQKFKLEEILGADRVADKDGDNTFTGHNTFEGDTTAASLVVTGTLQVNEVNINHIKHSGGVFLNTRANIVVSEVTQMSGGQTKLTFTRTAGSQTIYNLFEVGDFALSMMFNLKDTEGYQIGSDGTMTWTSSGSLIDVVRYYWREVVAVGSDYITLGAVPSNVYMSTPKVGDNVVQLGNKTDVSRQGCQVLGYSKTNGVFIAEYDGLTTNTQSSKAQSLALKVFDDSTTAIVYLSPKYHKLQGESILLKQGNNYIQLAETLTTMASNINTNATNIQTNAQTITTVANDVSVTAEEIRLEANNYTNLITNGKFEPNSSSVTGNYLPNGWTRYGSSYVYANQDNKTHGGVIVKTSGYGDSYYIQQSIIWSSVLSAGNMHTLSFWYKGSKVRVNLNGLSSYLPAKIIVNSNEVTHSGGQVEIATDSSKFTRQVIKFFVKGSFTGTVSGYLRFTAREGIGEIAMPQLNIGNVTSLDITAGKMLAVTDTYEIQNNKGETTFTIDEDGNIVGEGDASFKGIVKASGGEFTGKVTATDGKIGGVTINSDGSLEAENGASFKGDIYASGGTIGGLQVSSLSNTINSKTDQTVFEQSMNRIHMGVTNKVRNYITNPLAVDGTQGSVSSSSTVTDATYGSVKSIYTTSGGDWQWRHTIDSSYSNLTGGYVTWFCIVKPVNATSSSCINFGSGYSSSGATSHVAVWMTYNTTTSKVEVKTGLNTSYYSDIKTGCEPLNNGWYLCYTSAKLKSGTSVIPGQNIVGYNSTYGTWYLYYCGIVKGAGYPPANLLMEDTNLRDTGIDIEAKKITATADNFIVKNNSNNTTFTIDENGNIMGAANAMFKGNLCLPYLRLTSSNISNYRVTNFDGQQVINLSSSGLNLQVEVSGITLRLPQITSSMLGCEVNIFNATTGTIEINGSGRADTVSSGGYFCNLLKPSVSSSLRTNTTITINKFREAKFKAIYNGQGGHENFNYTWLCCYANINP